MSSTSNMQARFRGALIGVLVGDCVGVPYELIHQSVDPLVLIDKIGQIMKDNSIRLDYTDDSSMTMSICKSLLSNKGFNAKHMAKEFTETFYHDTKDRGYGLAVRRVFPQLRQNNYEDPFGPASRQFGGSGSYGNGAPMRCCGIALFAHRNNFDKNQTKVLTENCSKITHSHRHGINGAVLLVMAIRYVLSIKEESFDEAEFLNYLIREMSTLEDPFRDFVYTEKLNTIKKVIENLSINGQDISQKEIVGLLGNDECAQTSVPLAVYSFLRGVSKFTDSYKFDNEFLRTLHWAISCGGDTDTIAAMACGLSGAYLGIEKIPESLYKKCDSWQEMISYADQLFSFAVPEEKK